MFEEFEEFEEFEMFEEFQKFQVVQGHCEEARRSNRVSMFQCFKVSGFWFLGHCEEVQLVPIFRERSNKSFRHT
jgi:hypothetical protein